MKRLVSVFYRDYEEINKLNDLAREYALSKGIEYEWIKVPGNTKPEQIEALKGADAGIIDADRYDAEVFSRICERNRLLIRFGVGYDAVNLSDATKYGIKVARTQGANANGVAELALALVFALNRDFSNMSLNSERVWPTGIGTELSGCTFGILGFGAVGRKLARMLSGFGCRILAFDVYHDDEAARELGVEYADLETIFRSADVISSHLALNEGTRGIINRKLIGLMKESAIIVNTARGALVDDNDLYTALKERRIRGAGLDVFNTEPLPADSPYRGLDNVVLTPHIASSTFESFLSTYKMAVDIAYNYFNGIEDRRMLN